MKNKQLYEKTYCAMNLIYIFSYELVRYQNKHIGLFYFETKNKQLYEEKKEYNNELVILNISQASLGSK